MSVFVLAGCVFAPGETAEITVRFPPLPAAVLPVFGETAFRVDFPGPGGGILHAYSAPGAGTLAMEVPLDNPVPLSARLVSGERDDFFLPAGGLFPRNVGPCGEVEVSWENGFAADFSLRLHAAGFPLGEFNLARFFAETVLRGEGNPWFLNGDAIAAGLAGFVFRADMIKRLPVFPVVFAAPPGSWFGRNLLQPPAGTGTDGFLRPGNLPRGYHRFYGSGGGRMDVFVREDGTFICAESGMW